MTTPQGRPEQQHPSGPVNPNHPTQAFASPGQVPPGPPNQGPPSQGFPSQGLPPQGLPPQGLPPQGPPNQGPPNQGRQQGAPGYDQPTRSGPQGPPPQGRPYQGSPGLPPQGPPQHDGPWGPLSGSGARHPDASGPFGSANHVGAPRPQAANAIWALGLVSLVAVVCGLSISEDGKNAWETVHAWGALAILGSLMTLATVAAAGNLGATRAWQVAACGAGALVLFWVLFVLPSVGSNTSLVTTIGVAAGAVAVWIAPGRQDAGGPNRGPSGHTW